MTSGHRLNLLLTTALSAATFSTGRLLIDWKPANCLSFEANAS